MQPFNFDILFNVFSITGFVALQIDNAINTSFNDKTLLLFLSFNIGSKTLGLNSFISSGILDSSFIAFIIKELAALNNYVCLPVTIFLLGSSIAIK